MFVFGPATHFENAIGGLLLLGAHDGLVHLALEDSLGLFQLKRLLKVIGELASLLCVVVFGEHLGLDF